MTRLHLIKVVSAILCTLIILVEGDKNVKSTIGDEYVVLQPGKTIRAQRVKIDEEIVRYENRHI